MTSKSFDKKPTEQKKQEPKDWVRRKKVTESNRKATTYIDTMWNGLTRNTETQS